MLFGPLFVPDRLRAAVDDRAWLQAMLDAEAALARAEAHVGVIPAAAAEEIARCCLVERFDPDVIAREGRQSGNPAEPLVRALRKAVSEDAARYVHFGATSQDILDTAAMLVARQAIALILTDLDGLADGLAGLAEAYADTLMVGRTLLQQALPITFGLKAAEWLVGVVRARERLGRLYRHALDVQLGGAAGTLAALGEAGIAILQEYSRQLGFTREPDLPWHTERSRIAEIGAALALAAGTLDKIALDIILLAQSEVGEVREGGEGGGSSTLPQKRNPIGSVLTRARAREAQANGELLLRCMEQEHERAAGAWQAEWPALSAALAYTGGAAASLREVIEHLEVDTERLRANLDASNGLIMAERISFLLSERVGREKAQALMKAASRQVAAGQGTLGEVLAADREVRQHLSSDDIEAAMDPATYLGATRAFIDRAQARHAQDK